VGGICVVYRGEAWSFSFFVLSLSLCILLVYPLCKVMDYVERKAIEVLQ
jgi:hypothetical protein